MTSSWAVLHGRHIPTNPLQGDVRGDPRQRVAYGAAASRCAPPHRGSPRGPLELPPEVASDTPQNGSRRGDRELALGRSWSRRSVRARQQLSNVTRMFHEAGAVVATPRSFPGRCLRPSARRHCVRSSLLCVTCFTCNARSRSRPHPNSPTAQQPNSPSTAPSHLGGCQRSAHQEHASAELITRPRAKGRCGGQAQARAPPCMARRGMPARTGRATMQPEPRRIWMEGRPPMVRPPELS